MSLSPRALSVRQCPVSVQSGTHWCSEGVPKGDLNLKKVPSPGSGKVRSGCYHLLVHFSKVRGFRKGNLSGSTILDSILQDLHSLYIHSTLTLHSLYPHSTLTLRSLYAHSTFTLHSLYTSLYTLHCLQNRFQIDSF